PLQLRKAAERSAAFLFATKKSRPTRATWKREKTVTEGGHAPSPPPWPLEVVTQGQPHAPRRRIADHPPRVGIGAPRPAVLAIFDPVLGFLLIEHVEHVDRELQRIACPIGRIGDTQVQ